MKRTCATAIAGIRNRIRIKNTHLRSEHYVFSSTSSSFSSSSLSNIYSTINVANLAKDYKWEYVDISSSINMTSPPAGGADLDLGLVPLIIPSSQTHCNLWPAFKEDRWSLSNLRKYYGKSLFECGKDSFSNNEPIIRSLDKFIDVCLQEASEETLTAIISTKGSDSYLFDSTFDYDCPGLSADYSIPDVFSRGIIDFDSLDQLDIMNGNKKSNDNNDDYDDTEEPPNYKWFLLGAKYSGSPLHIDPLHTSAWNTLVKGKKLWVILEPEEQEPLSELPDADTCINSDKSNNNSSGSSSSSNSIMYTPMQFFADVLPQMMLSSHHAVNKKKLRTRKFYHFVQLPGETVYVPFGMPHAVLNDEISVAITHNFVKKSSKVQTKRFIEALHSRSRRTRKSE